MFTSNYPYHVATCISSTNQDSNQLFHPLRDAHIMAKSLFIILIHLVLNVVFCSPVLQDYCSLDLALCWFSRRQLSSVYLPSCVLSLDLLTALHQLIHLNKHCSKFYSLLQDLFFTNHDILMAFRSFFIYFFILMYSVVEHSVCFEKYIVIIKYFLELLLNASLISPTSY